MTIMQTLGGEKRTARLLATRLPAGPLRNFPLAGGAVGKMTNRLAFVPCDLAKTR